MKVNSERKIGRELYGAKKRLRERKEGDARSERKNRLEKEEGISSQDEGEKLERRRRGEGGRRVTRPAVDSHERQLTPF